jgi:hypothetical protein
MKLKETLLFSRINFMGRNNAATHAIELFLNESNDMSTVKEWFILTLFKRKSKLKPFFDTGWKLQSRFCGRWSVMFHYSYFFVKNITGNPSIHPIQPCVLYIERFLD